MSHKLNIVIAGASGFIGRALIPKILEQFPEALIYALSRTERTSTNPQVKNKACDLFSLKSIENALPKEVDIAIYLVHSMGPTAHLDQGTFADYDLILADNFARAISKTNLKQLIFLGGLIPDVPSLSLHLRSRREIEETFWRYNLNATVFRAGLILGGDGSSFQMLLKLVKRLPVMICPKWTQTFSTPVDLETVVSSIVKTIMQSEHMNKTYDLAGCEPISYKEMMNAVATKMKVKRLFISFPFFTPNLSRLWVSLVTNSPRDLVYPLIESLEHPMVARENYLFDQNKVRRSFSELIKNISFKIFKSNVFFRFVATSNTVRSVQRLPLPKNKTAKWVKDEYMVWLPKFLRPFIFVKVSGNCIKFLSWIPNKPLLVLEFSEERSLDDRQLLYITGGLLAKKNELGRLEFREVLDKSFVMAAIHDFKPRLPWFIYIWSQAKIHLFVMKAFARHLSKIKQEKL